MNTSSISKSSASRIGILAVMLFIGCTPHALSQRVLLDCCYNSEWRKDASGALVRYHYVWSDTTNSGFSQLGRIIQAAGGSIDTLCQAPTEQTLRGAGIYLIVDPDTPKETQAPHYVQPAEADAIEAWVKAGGILALFGNDKGNAEFEHFNTLAERFGIHFNEVSNNKVQGNNYATGAFDSLPSHPLFAGVQKIFLKEISTLKLNAAAKPILTSGEDVIMASTEFGKGFVFAVGDPWLYNEYMDHRRLPADYENDIAAKNLFRWLLDRTRKANEQGVNQAPPLPFDMSPIQVPEFSARQVNILEYGAVADGRTMNTKAFADAIAACSKAGGGMVIVPAGTWRTAPIRLENNVNLHLMASGTLRLFAVGIRERLSSNLSRGSDDYDTQ